MADATPRDALLVADLARRTFSEAFAERNDPADFKAYLDEAFAPEQIARELADPNATFLLAYLDPREPQRSAALRAFADRPLGYCKLRRQADIDCLAAQRPIELQRMYVEQALVGLSLGSLLMTAALERARSEQHDWMWLCSWELNEGANRFYRRHGFQQVGERDFLMGRDRQRDLVLARAL